MTLNFIIFYNDMKSKDIFSFQIEDNALKIAFCVQCYSVVSFSTAHYSVHGVNLYNILD